MDKRSELLPRRVRRYFMTFAEESVDKGEIKARAPNFLSGARRLLQASLHRASIPSPHIVIDGHNDHLLLMSATKTASNMASITQATFPSDRTTAEAIVSRNTHCLHVLVLEHGTYARADVVQRLNEMLKTEFADAALYATPDKDARNSALHLTNNPPAGLVRFELDAETQRVRLLNSSYATSLLLPPATNYTKSLLSNPGVDSSVEAVVFHGVDTEAAGGSLARQTYLRNTSSVWHTLGFQLDDTGYTLVPAYSLIKDFETASRTLVTSGDVADVSNSITRPDDTLAHWDANVSSIQTTAAGSSCTIRRRTRQAGESNTRRLSQVTNTDSASWVASSVPLQRFSALDATDRFANITTTGASGAGLNASRTALSARSSANAINRTPIFIVLRESNTLSHVMGATRNSMGGAVLGYVNVGVGMENSHVVGMPGMHANASLQKAVTLRLVDRSGAIMHFGGQSMTITIAFDVEEPVALH